MIGVCPVCLRPVTWDAPALIRTGARLIKDHRDGMSRPCITTGQPFRIAFNDPAVAS